jgi:hypothetical protein
MAKLGGYTSGPTLWLWVHQDRERSENIRPENNDGEEGMWAIEVAVKSDEQPNIWDFAEVGNDSGGWEDGAAFEMINNQSTTEAMIKVGPWLGYFEKYTITMTMDKKLD